MTRAPLKSALMAMLHEGKGNFASLATRLFAYQFQENPRYRRFCEKRGASPETVQEWTQIPAVATDVFRQVQLFCGPSTDIKHTFRTSGTTHGRRGEHHLRDLDLYHESARRHLARFMFPEAGQHRALILTPTPAQLPDSSLSSMMGLIAEEFVQESYFAWTDKPDLNGAIEWLKNVGPEDAPVALLTTTFAGIALLDEIESQGLSFKLPKGSFVMTTGGSKGKSREMSPQDQRTWIASLLGIEAWQIISEYGMSELGSQFYDPCLTDPTKRGEDRLDLDGGQQLVGPAWCRVTAHDPLTGEQVPEGQEGLLRMTDLANIDSVVAIQTADRGIIHSADPSGDTFVLLGRHPGSVPRGCSLTAMEAMNE